jgi:hypothetical protein
VRVNPEIIDLQAQESFPANGPAWAGEWRGGAGQRHPPAVLIDGGLTLVASEPRDSGRQEHGHRLGRHFWMRPAYDFALRVVRLAGFAEFEEMLELTR